MAETKLSTQQLGGNEKVWNESNLVSGKNVKIEKHIDPNVITEDTIGVWHFDTNPGYDIVNELHLDLNKFDTNNYKFGDGTASQSAWKFLSASSYYKPSYYANWLGADVSSYNIGASTNSTVDFWFKPSINTSLEPEKKATIIAFLYKESTTSYAHGISIIPSHDNSTISFGANSYATDKIGTIFIENVPVNATFNHIAFTYAGDVTTTVVSVYVNGIYKGQYTFTNEASFPYRQFCIYTTNGNNDDPSWIDELRLSKGIVYTDDFSDDLPTEAYQAAGSTPDYWELNTTGLAKSTELAAKQDTLVAGTNISIAADGKTISATDTTYSAFTGTDGSAAGTAGLVPAPATTDDGKYLKADGTWATVSTGDSLPDQTGQSGKFLTTNGTTASWATVQQSGGVAPTTKSFTGQTGSTLATGLTLADYDTIMVFKNGMLLEEATADPVAANDYSISTNSIVFVDALGASDTVTWVWLGEVTGAGGGTSDYADVNLSNLTNEAKPNIIDTLSDIYKTVQYSVVGSPTFTGGVVSGFSAADYLTLTKNPTIGAGDDFEISVCFSVSCPVQKKTTSRGFASG